MGNKGDPRGMATRYVKPSTVEVAVAGWLIINCMLFDAYTALIWGGFGERSWPALLGAF